MFAWQNLEKPIIALSPMADMTDSSFCQIVKRFPCPIVFREMISAEAITRGNEKSLGMGDFVEGERPIIQQLFGSDPAMMAEATRRIDAAYHPDGFDINMGCPVYKIVSNFNGAALMNEPERATAIIKAMKQATRVPVSVKIRLGWSDPRQCIDFVKVLEAAGADLITIHGRTKAQAYSGVADWKMIGEAKKQVKIPVLANGDITDAARAQRALSESGADGILIARGALGNPWIFAELAAALHGQGTFVPPTPSERASLVMDHATLHVGQYGERGMVTFRKHLSWYFKGWRGAKSLREQLVRVTTLAELDELLKQFVRTNESGGLGAQSELTEPSADEAASFCG